MPSFGERLKHEREARNTTIEEMALATGIQLGYLEALEKSESDALPGRAFGKLYIRAYAEILGFDPQPLIDDYDREQHLKLQASAEPWRPEPARPRPVAAAIARWREAKIAERSKPARDVLSVEAEPERPAEVPVDESAGVRDGEPAPAVSASEGSAPFPKTASRSSRPVVIALLFSGLFLAAAAAYFTLSRPGAEGETARESPAPVEPASEPRPVPAELPAAPPPTEPVPGATGQGHLAVPEFGVGRRIVKRRLEGQDERFAEGEVVWFSTRVLGGKHGEPVRHVWLHEGRGPQSIKLALGGPDWRTHSRMRVRGIGRWIVEARDEEGRVLARATFTCVP